jgi:hypothetical protein
MERRNPRDWRAGDNFNRETSSARERRPERLAFWAVVLCVTSMLLAAVSAHAASGGTAGSGGMNSDGTPGMATTPPPGTAPASGASFGARVLSPGMTGDDVKVLNGIVKSKSYATDVSLSTTFEEPTAGAVKEFQNEAGLPATGVVDKTTSSALAHSMGRLNATWYGPGLYGNRTACGKVLRRSTVGVASRSLPCGTKITFGYHGHYTVAKVIDRGPFAKGVSFDLTSATAQALGFGASGPVRYAVAVPGSDSRGL